MKKLLTLAAILLVFTSFAQNFEGKIIYSNTYKSKNPAMTDQQLTEQLGNEQEYFFKDNRYKSVFNGKMLQWQLYEPKQNKLFNKFAANEIIYYNDAGINTDKVLEARLNLKAATIAGTVCDELILICKSGMQKYYFSNEYAVDAAFYDKHLFGNWSEYLKKAHALPLKTIIENNQFIFTSEAKKIIPEELKSSEFDLPSGARTSQMPM